LEARSGWVRPIAVAHAKKVNVFIVISTSCILFEANFRRESRQALWGGYLQTSGKNASSIFLAYLD
jgi:hypothetical protein